jgi:endosialidase-like protein
MGGGSDTTSTQQNQQTTQLPPWVNTAAQQNYALAQNIGTRPLQQYQGQLVADAGPQMQQAWNTAAAGGGAGQSQYDASQAGYLGVMGQAPQQVTPGQLSTTNLQPYMSPYTSSVINATLPIMQQNLGLQQAGNQASAAQAGAYGGSRQGVQQGVTQAQGAMNMAQMAAQLNQANFGQAQAAAGQDISTNLQGQLANQKAQQDQAALNLQGAQGLAGLGQQAQLSQARNFTEQATAGAAEQQQAQNQINANMQQFQQAWQYPYQQLGVLQSALGMTPYGTAQQGQTTTQTQQSADPFAAALSGLSSLGSLFSAPAGGTSAASGFMSFLGGLSDRRMKTDIAKIGVHPSGVPLYSFRYKGDPKSYPKVVGPMAEDVAKIAPHAVAPIPGSGGKMAIHPAFTGALGAPGAMPAPAPGLPIGAAPTAGRPPGIRLPAPNLTAIAGAGPAPGALAPPTPVGAIGALGGSMRRPPQPRRIMRPPPLRGALGG